LVVKEVALVPGVAASIWLVCHLPAPLLKAPSLVSSFVVWAVCGSFPGRPKWAAPPPWATAAREAERGAPSRCAPSSPSRGARTPAPAASQQRNVWQQMEQVHKHHHPAGMTQQGFRSACPCKLHAMSLYPVPGSSSVQVPVGGTLFRGGAQRRALCLPSCGFVPRGASGVGDVGSGTPGGLRAGASAPGAGLSTAPSEGVPSAPNCPVCAAVSGAVAVPPHATREVAFSLAWDVPIAKFGKGSSYYRRYTQFYGPHGRAAPLLRGTPSLVRLKLRLKSCTVLYGSSPGHVPL